MPLPNVMEPFLAEVTAISILSFTANDTMTLSLKNACSFPVSLRISVASGRFVLFFRTDTVISPVAAGSMEAK